MPALSGSVIVTGSARGLGPACAERLARDGSNVVINYVSKGSAAVAQQLVDEINSRKAGKAIAIQADMSTLDGPKHLADEAVKHFGSISSVVHMAGVMPRGAGPDFSPESFANIFNCNVRGPLLLTQALVPQMKPGSSVIFVSSSLTRLNGAPPPELLYIASKGAIEQATRVLSKAYGAKGIRVCCIAPGPCDTEMFTKPKTQEQIDFFVNLSPFKRLGRPEDIANATAFLVSNDASWVSGTTLFVNGANQV